MEPTSDADEGRSRSLSPVDSDNEHGTGMPTHMITGTENGPGKTQNGSTSNAKDPNRPRRKKARRACYACQRAHLTCGDERPCQRCIKRGLADVCQDGVRKKAKYLHDAPSEALLPGAANNYSHPKLKRSSSGPPDEPSQPPYYPQQQQSFNIFPHSSQMPPPSLHERTMSSSSFTQQSPVNTAFSMPSVQPTSSPSITREHQSSVSGTSNGWGNTMFNAEDPPFTSFDLASMNFGNHYGALEFGMLGHMATAAGNTPESETATQRGSVGQYPVGLGSYGESPTNSQFPYGDTMMNDWNNSGGIYGHMPRKQEGPNAFAIEANVHFMSPEDVSTPPDGAKYDDVSMMSRQVQRLSDVPPTFLQLTHADHNTKQPVAISTPQLKAKSQLPVKQLKRPRDPSSIYTSVTQPYPYTAGFHSLIAYLQRRFANSPSKTLAIAKSLASIRPSFIATTKTLNREDLIFMEKCFQRTLWEYEGFIEGVGTPTIVARRTGEIAAVGKEFQILTGWKKNVLLGREPNLNVNRGHTGGTPIGSGANTSRGTGTTTPALRYAEPEGGEARQQPVFLSELLDDDSVVQFYEDFARLAFGDSRGSVMSKGKLLKYRTKDDELSANLKAEAEARGEAVDRPEMPRRDTFAQTRPQDAKKGISGEKGMQRLGSSDGKVDCAYCWTVKRDVFDIPMLIVMNFLPCI